MPTGFRDKVIHSQSNHSRGTKPLLFLIAELRLILEEWVCSVPRVSVS